MIGRAPVIVLTVLAMLAFAGNSLLCRLALQQTDIDAATFTFVRIVAGAAALWMIVRLRAGTQQLTGTWFSALALFAYAAGFSFAYLSLSAGTGALLLFGAVQVTMIGVGLWRGERMRPFQIVGFVLAFAGLVGLLLPGISAPPLFGAILMLGAGVAWGIYSLRGKGAGDATAATAGNFVRAVPFAVVLSIIAMSSMSLDRAGVMYAVLSGALTSGVGYAIWYTALRGLSATSAATVQLSVPVITALGGIAFLSEPITGRFVVASIAVLGGIALVIMVKRSTGEAKVVASAK